MTPVVRLRAHAKLTLSLRVLGRRDDGYHEIEALVASLDGLYDEVEVEVVDAPEISLEVTGPAAGGVPTDGSNLAVRAARLVLGRDGGAVVRLHKTVPAGAGLGGGSADAAAVLRALAPPGLDLPALAAELGSDVPFCVTGGLAWMRGRGERVEPVAPGTRRWAVVAVPPFGISTADVYAAWDDLGGPTGLVNDLEPAALAVEPRLAAFRDALAAATGLPPTLAGSGSAWFFLAETEEEAKDVASRIGPGPRGVLVSPVAG